MTDEVVTYLRVLARAQDASAAADWARAAALWEQVTQSNPVNGNYRACLAEALFGLQDFARAADAYEKVLELGVRRPLVSDDEMVADDVPELIPGEVIYRIAACLAGAGDRERAIAVLGLAVQKGFRDLARAREDKVWGSLTEDQRVRDLLGIIDTAALSRDEGWRGDLQFLSREIKRRAYAPVGEITEADFDRRVSELDTEIPVLGNAQIIVKMMALVRYLGDGHAYVAPAKNDHDLAIALPLDFFHFAEGVFVIGGAAGHSRLFGAQVERVGDRDVAEVMNGLDPVLARDNNQQVRYVAPLWLRYTPLLHALGLINDFVGKPTGSRPNFIGESLPFELPYSHVQANVADLYWQTSWPSDHRTWIAPHIYAPPTFEAFSQNRDPAMDAILASHEHLPSL